jgi:hypothetical protein
MIAEVFKNLSFPSKCNRVNALKYAAFTKEILKNGYVCLIDDVFLSSSKHLGHLYVFRPNHEYHQRLGRNICLTLSFLSQLL